jgi:2-keto-myo-inositol isomerase
VNSEIFEPIPGHVDQTSASGHHRALNLSRRGLLSATAGWLAGSTFLGHPSPVRAQVTSAASQGQTRPLQAPAFRYCLNTSTINGSQVPVQEQLQIAAEAGYDSVELWVRDIDRYLSSGGTTQELRKQIADLGLGVDSAIAFGQWIVDDAELRRQGLEQCKRDMTVIRELGGQRIAAPPSGATREPALDLNAAAQRYHALLEVGNEVGVIPQIELWGFSKNISTLAEVLYVAAATNHPEACILLDVYHMYKGGSDFSNIGLVPGRKLHCLHMNDYPAEPPREAIADEHRVYPGDGTAPMTHILRNLIAGGFAGTLSLELFNRSYWQQPPAEVAKTGLQKMKSCVEAAFAAS